MMQPYLEDDDHTAPTSMQDSGNHRGDHSLATDTGSTSLGSGDDAASAQQWAASKIEKMIQKTRVSCRKWVGHFLCICYNGVSYTYHIASTFPLYYIAETTLVQ